VQSHDGFTRGDAIIIDAGKPNEEDNRIASFGSIILETPLIYDHSAGATVATIIQVQTFLAHTAEASSTFLQVQSISGFWVGDTITITGLYTETHEISKFFVDGSTYFIYVREPLKYTHVEGSTVTTKRPSDATTTTTTPPVYDYLHICDNCTCQTSPWPDFGPDDFFNLTLQSCQRLCDAADSTCALFAFNQKQQTCSQCVL